MKKNAFILLGLLAVLACGGGAGGLENPDGDANTDTADPSTSADPTDTTDTSAAFSAALTNDEWDEIAVRKVLHTFAYGGSAASDAQITQWAGLPPEEAIAQILTLDSANPLLSPPQDGLDSVDGSLTALSVLWSSDLSLYPADVRKKLEFDHFEAPARLWLAGVNKRGLNPFRFKIGLFETNYHLALSLNAGISNLQMLRYYDDIIGALETNSSYQQVLAKAALSAACATQYNHKENIFKDARFSGNEDFAREFHQLFFGILGEGEPDYHEITTIRNTAKALTDMSIPTEKKPDGSSQPATEVTFGTELHYPGTLDILHESVAGLTAREMITTLADKAVYHRESLSNLPLIIVRTLADDNLTPEKTAAVQKLWADTQPKNLLTFLRRYAISKAFHDASRVKYLSSLDRLVLISNLITLDNEESYTSSYDPRGFLEAENYYLFRPTHDVFGSQTGLEAAGSASVLKEAYNRSIDLYWWFNRTDVTQNGTVIWEKDWAAVIPPAADGGYHVKEVGEWLWNRFMADGLKNFGTLERAQVYALIGSGKDFSLFVDPGLPLQVYGKKEIETDNKLKELVRDMEVAVVNLDHADRTKRIEANRRIGMAVAFMAATPFMFAEEGR